MNTFINFDFVKSQFLSLVKRSRDNAELRAKIRACESELSLADIPRYVALNEPVALRWRSLAEDLFERESDDVVAEQMRRDRAFLAYGAPVKTIWEGWEHYIGQLSDEAREAGDEDQVTLCRRAKRNRAALRACLKTMIDTRSLKRNEGQ